MLTAPKGQNVKAQGNAWVLCAPKGPNVKAQGNALGTLVTSK
jgi:hypothetical protein